MKKEKKVRTYQRRTKSGKTITVRAHTASYEAAEKAKEASKKKGAGDELSSKVKKGEEWKLPMDEFLKKLKEERAEKKWNDEVDKSWKSEDEKPKKKSEKKTEKKTPAKKATKKRTVGTGTNGPEPKKKVTTKKTAAKADTSEPAFTRDEFKEWYRGTGSAADKKVAKALRKQLGSSGYRKFEDEAIDNYTSRGHLSMFKRVSGGSSASANTKSSAKENKVPKAKSEKKPVKGSLGITKSEFKAWYSDTDGSSASFKKVNRALKKFYGKDWDEVENRATFGGKTQYQDMLREIGSRFSTSPKTTAKATSKSSVKAAPKSETFSRNITNGPEPKKKSEEVKKELARQKAYVKYLSRWSRVPAMKSYLNAQSKILSDLKSYSGPIKTDREIDNSTMALAKKHGLSYEGDGEFRDKKSGKYRISTNPITGISTLHPLTEHPKPIVKRRK